MPRRAVVLDDSGEESDDDDDAGLRQTPRGAEMRTTIDLTRDGELPLLRSDEGAVAKCLIEQ